MENFHEDLNQNRKPLYLQVEETLREMIEGVDFEAGDRIPSERELADMMKVSRMTVRRAVEQLVVMGLLEHRSTSGTYVCEPEVRRTLSPNRIQGLSRQIENKGGRAGSRLLKFEIIRAPKKVAEYLCVRVGRKVILIQRLRLVDELPFCVETSYLLAEIFPDLSPEDVSGQQSLYELFRQRYQVNAAYSADILKISTATEEETALLGLESKAPVFYFRSIVYDAEGVPFEYVKSINHPKRVAFQSETRF